ncbi:MAG TPA: glycosyltransferase [Coriobacteriia bacterium]
MSAAPFPDVDVVIAAHDAGASLADAVASARREVAPGRVIVVDSGSIDGAVDRAAAEFPDIRVIRTEDRGLAAAGNAGLVATCGEFVVFLASDAVLDERSVDTLVSRARANRTAGIVAPRVTDADGSTREGSFGAFPALLHAVVSGVNQIVHRSAKGKDARSWLEVHGTTSVDWVTGACMLVRRHAVEAVGAMDEGFSRHFGDIDWCRRMHDGGWVVLLEPLSTCVHASALVGAEEAPAATKVYRADFLHYCKLHRLHAYAFVARIGLTGRRPAGGRG